MAEAITYADLRFVKAPLKNVTCQLGQDVDEDGDITYENVQVCPAPGALASLASSGPGNNTGPCTGLGSEQHPSPWPSATALATGRVLCGRAICTKYVLLGLLLGCLLLGVAAIGLGVRYLQVSQQLQRVHRNLEFTNSSLGQQLHEAEAKLKKQEEELQGTKQELIQSKMSLNKVQQDSWNTQGRLDDCHKERDETRATLQSEQTQRSSLEQRLDSMRDKLRRLFTCTSTEQGIEAMQDSCCPVGWIPSKGSKRVCFHFSPTKRTWQESQEYCRSLSSELATKDNFYSISYISDALYSLLEHLPWPGFCWISYRYMNYGKMNDYKKLCVTVQNTWGQKLQLKYDNCDTLLPCICELEAVRHSYMEDSLH